MKMSNYLILLYLNLKFKNYFFNNRKRKILTNVTSKLTKNKTRQQCSLTCPGIHRIQTVFPSLIINCNFKSIVGDADGGKMFTPKEYESFKKKMLKTSKNRVYTSWWNSKGILIKTFD
jgi:hypothetical protein